MGFVRLCVAAGTLTVLAQSGGAIVHLQESPADRFVACVARTLGTPVFAEPGVGHRIKAEIPCDVTRDNVATWVKDLDVTLASTPPGHPAYLLPSDYLRGDSWRMRITWGVVSIATRFETVTTSEDGRPVDAERVPVFGAQFLRDLRPAPLIAPWDPAQGTNTADVIYSIVMQQRRLRPDGPESVIALMGVDDGGPRRLGYGEIVDGALRILWDSPVFSGFRLGLGFDDVNGDGEEEIVLAHSEGANATGYGLIIFDRAGRELTRQEGANECERMAWDRAGVVCPIYSVDYNLVSRTPAKPAKPTAKRVGPPKPAPKDIVTQAMEGDRTPTTYRLDRAGRYRPLR
jgi:hypothetical protein